MYIYFPDQDNQFLEKLSIYYMVLMYLEIEIEVFKPQN